VLGSAKGWAASLMFHPSLRYQFQAFLERTDTFSLGVCNGCQLMSLLGWVGLKSTGKYPDIVDVFMPSSVSCLVSCLDSHSIY
jgi:Phosphoribosylformylglycinamidine (FGAM) synthase, glutamine amidotransferase domain